MNKITSESLDNCLAYCETKELDATNYGTFIRALVYTMKMALPVEIVAHETDHMVKALLQSFSIEYTQGQEGDADMLHVHYTAVGETTVKTLKFEPIAKSDVTQDKKNNTRTFYRYYIHPDKKTGYRFTFNRRITKAQ